MRVNKLSVKKLSVISFLLLALLFTVSNAEIYPEWAFQIAVKLNTSSSGADVTGSVDNFPVLIQLDESNFTFEDAQPNGEDIRFSLSDETTPLAYEIERWDSNGKEAEIWVLVDHIAGGDSTQYIIMYHGNENAVDESDPDAVFETSNDFSAVWHLNEDPTTGSGCIKDRTSNANNATPGGYMTASDQVDGRIGKAIDFDGLNDNLNAGSGSSLDNLEVFTIAAWINPKGWGENGFGRIVDKWDDYNYYGALKFLLNNNTSSGYNKTITLNREYSSGENYFTASNYSLGLNEWAYVVAVMNGNTECRLYINGTEASYYTQWFGSGSLWSDAARDLIIGNRQYGDRAYYGVIDELRISNSIRSADWIKLSYENQREEQMLVEIVECIECRALDTLWRSYTFSNNEKGIKTGKYSIPNPIPWFPPIRKGYENVGIGMPPKIDRALAVGGESFFGGMLKIAATDTTYQKCEIRPSQILMGDMQGNTPYFVNIEYDRIEVFNSYLGQGSYIETNNISSPQIKATEFLTTSKILPYGGGDIVYLEGSLYTREVYVTLDDFPDYVFSKDYNLKSLTELEKYVKENNHLPGIPSEQEVKEKGLGLGDMQVKLLEKIEEVTLYIIQLEKRVKELETEVQK